MLTGISCRWCFYFLSEELQTLYANVTLFFLAPLAFAEEEERHKHPITHT